MVSEELTPEEQARRALFASDEEAAPEKSEAGDPSINMFETEIAEGAAKEDAEAAAAEQARKALFASDEAETAAPVVEESTPSLHDLEPEVVEAPPEAAEAEEPEPEEPQLSIVPPPDDGIKRRWYAVHVHSGQEATVQKSLYAQAEQEGLTDQVTNILVPMEQVQEYKSGQKKLSKRKYFPGYILMQLPEHPERNPDLWHLIKDTAGVTGFIGSRNEPVPLEDSEVTAIVEEIRGERERPRPKVMFEIDERVKIIDGPFANFMGNIGEINEERGKMKVMIEIFERQTSVEVEFWQVEKL